MTPRSLTHEFAKIAGRVKDVPRVRFHDLRHSHATQLLASGVHPKVVQERLGHASITMTMDVHQFNARTTALSFATTAAPPDGYLTRHQRDMETIS